MSKTRNSHCKMLFSDTQDYKSKKNTYFFGRYNQTKSTPYP